MSSMPAPIRRHALGLPAGSVRAAHVLGIVALICAIILIPPRAPNVATIPPYLIYLLFIMLGHYFASHGVTIATRDDPAPSPLFLPGGLVRFLIILALCGTVGWKLYSDELGFEEQFKKSVKALENDPFLPLIILGAFFGGVIVRWVVGRINPPAALQDFEAWLSLMALVVLFIAGIIHLGVNLSIPEIPDWPVWEACVGAIIAFYFGERT
jgi:hypothetical protein